ncbi:MAG: BatA domain-containing protein [Gemmatimonadaceae bacterium]
MSFVAPVWLAIAGLVAAGVVVAHLITRSQPRHDVLPTARFIPQTAPLTVTRTRRPTDLLLLLVRLLALALLGLALAGAHVTRSAPVRVTIIDQSTAAGDGDELRRQATAATDGVVMSFGDSVGPATLSGALVAAHRAIAGRDDRERTELVIVSRIAREQVDSATAPLLALWPGPVRVERLPGTAIAAVPHVRLGAAGDDPVAAAVGSTRDAASPARFVRVLRTPEPPTESDSAWARDSAGALVIWPTSLSTSTLTRRETVDTAQGIAAGFDVVVGSFLRTHRPRAGRVLVRWIDGEPAASEVGVGKGCIREVAIPVDAAGDVALRESFRRIVDVLTSACGGPRDLAPANLASLLPSGTESVRSADASLPGTRWLAPGLAVAALVVLLVEQLLRRRQPA